MNVLALAVAQAGAYGVFLLYTAAAFGWRGLGGGDGRIRSQKRWKTSWKGGSTRPG